MKKKWYFFALFLVTVFISSAFTPKQDYKFHTVFVYNFVKYVQWPTYSNDKIIAIYSEDPTLLHEFVKMARYKNTADRKIIIKAFTSVDDIPEAHAIFIPSDKTRDLKTIRSKTSNKPVLFITEGSGNLAKGSNINLVMHKGRLNFEVSRTNLEKNGLKISKKLLDLAIKVS